MITLTRLGRPSLSLLRVAPTSLPCLGLRAYSSSIPSTIPSLTYPGLFYHPLPGTDPAKPSYQLSFLPEPAPNPAFSPTTLGTFSPPAELVEGLKLEQGEVLEVSPRGFVENELFKEVLHTVLEEGVKTDLEVQTAAVVRGDGYIHIADVRKPADPNRVPDPNDIIASVLVQNGKVHQGEGGYEKGELHRLVTMDGAMRLSEGLMALLQQALVRVRGMEKEIAGAGKR